ncbi:hypothetical protein [Achromobacter piechaudii]|uniref:hypothetical protein n=1 Tax=Achromobacter piechaudii TaxID=72556 RepID=UPI0015817B35|nr:hypothetical protein [Achromobacter piechaudii]
MIFLQFQEPHDADSGATRRMGKRGLHFFQGAFETVDTCGGSLGDSPQNICEVVEGAFRPPVVIFEGNTHISAELTDDRIKGQHLSGRLSISEFVERKAIHNSWQFVNSVNIKVNGLIRNVSKGLF